MNGSVGTVIAVDSNLLVYAHRARVPQHRAARRALQQASADGRGWGIPLPCIAEFWSVVTQPASVGGPATPAEARSFLVALVREAEAAIWLPGDNFWDRLTQMAEDLRIHAARVFDLQVALVAFENGATELWTHDADFVSLPGLRVYDPL